MTNTITPVFLSSQAYAVKHPLQPANPNSLCSSQTRNFSSPIKMFSLSEFQINSTSIRNPRLMSPAVVASRSDYHNKLVPIDRVLHALHGKSCRLGRIDRNHHEGGDYGLFWHQKSRRNEKLEKRSWFRASAVERRNVWPFWQPNYYKLHRH